MALMLVVSGCAAPTGDDDPSVDDSESALVEKYDVNNLLEDDDVRGGTKLSAERIQKFLQDKGSYLATYAENKRSAATMIAESAARFDINPVYLLARIQVESSLITSGTNRSIKSATGCACPDNAACSRQSAGFGKQVECAAGLHAAYFDEIDRNGETRAAWAVGRKKRTLDPCSVTPRNKATAAIYTYTPWVGTRGQQCSSRGSSGSTTLVAIYKGYAAELSSL